MSFVTIKQTNNKFIDLDLSFVIHPVNGDIGKKVNESAVIASIKNLVMTRLYDRPFHPEISSQVYDLLFEPLNPGTAAALKRAILYVINNFEPRAEVQLIDVQESPDTNAIEVTLFFSIIGSVNTIKTTFFLERLL